jgi:hypothetical protein
MNENKTSNIVSKIAITFNDGSFVELLDQERYLKIRNEFINLSSANNALNLLNTSMEKAIEKLQKENSELDTENQYLKAILHSSEYVNIDTEFKNPLA